MKTALEVSETRHALHGAAVALSADPAITESEIEVILSGDYKVRNLVIGDKEIASMIDNHARAGVDPAVDREHESWSALQLEPSPAMGWVKKLAMQPSAADPKRNALVATVEWTDVGAKALAAKHYRYVSAGLDLKAKDRLTGKDIGVMLDHVALVKHPFVQGMKPLSLSADEPINEEKPMKSLLLALGVKEDATEEQATAALTSKLTAKDAEVNSVKAENVALKAQSIALETRTAALELAAKAANTARLTALLDDKIAKFAVDPAERAAQLELAAASPETFEKLLALRVPRNPSGPVLRVVKGDVSTLALQQKAITEYIAANAGADEVTALIALSAEKPELFKEVV